MNELCLIVVYFGKLNNYFDLWLKSAEANPTVDFLIATDQQIMSNSKNINIVNMTLNEFIILAQDKIKTKIKISKAYKICDFKPAFGHIFEDYIRDYDFWGHCDLDIIWGDIRFFLDFYNYSSYDKFLDRGHLTIYRNIDRINKLYTTIIPGEFNYKKIFLYQHNFLFDESPLLEKICKKNNVVVFNEPISIDVDVIYNRFKHAFPEKSKRNINYENQLFYYEDGHVYQSYELEDNIYSIEYAYIHLQKRKKLKKSSNLNNSFYITNKGFFNKDYADVTLDDIKRYNNYPGEDFEFNEYMNYYRKSRKNRVKNRIEKTLIGGYLIRLYNEIKYRFN